VIVAYCCLLKKAGAFATVLCNLGSNRMMLVRLS
jgi:hypothetical protein